MRNLVRTVGGLAAVLVLAACTAAPDLGELQAIKPAGDDFSKGLYKGYAALAKAEYDEADWKDSAYFARKAEDAAIGVDVLPDKMDQRKIPGGAVEELAAARGRLVSARSLGGRKKAGGDLARAQTSFDCWMQEQEENIQSEDILACRSRFLIAMSKVEAAMEAKPKAKAAPAAREVARHKFHAFFGLDKSDLDSAAMAVVAKAAAQVKKADTSRVWVLAHTDRSGSADYNKKLAGKRADAVQARLTALGVDAKLIGKAVYGEVAPPVETADGVAEARNRRVEIVVVQ